MVMKPGRLKVAPFGRCSTLPSTASQHAPAFGFRFQHATPYGLRLSAFQLSLRAEKLTSRPAKPGGVLKS
jgi:hypothetical protein